MASATRRRNSRTVKSVPVRLDRAARRKLTTDTPGISSGYWKARNMPARPRWSGAHPVMSSPL